MPSKSEFIVENSDIDYLVSLVLKSIPSESHNPSRGGLCAPAFARSFEHLLVMSCPPGPYDLSFTYPELRKRHPAFFNAMFSFVFGISTEEQIRSLEQSFPHCHCDVGKNAFLGLIHDKDDSRDFPQHLCYGIFCFAQNIVSLSTDTLFRSIQGDTKGQKKRGNALREFSKYLVQDAHTPHTIHACFCWYKATKSEAILRFISPAFKRHPKAFRTPACAPEGQQFLSMVASDLRDVIMRMKQDSSSITSWTVSNVVAAIQFLYAFMLLLPPSVEFEHSCIPVIQEVSTAFFIEIWDNLDTVKRQLFVRSRVPRLLAGIALLVVNFKVDNLPYPEKIVPHFGGSCTEIEGAYIEGCMFVSNIKEKKQCANVGCGILPVDHRFPKCAQCGVPSYCSRKCQMEAWSHPVFSHRSVCKDWGTMIKHCPDLGELREFHIEMDQQGRDRLKALIEALGISESRMLEIKEHDVAYYRATQKTIPRGMEEFRILASYKSANLSSTTDAVASAATGTKAKELTPPSSTSQALPRLRGMFNKTSASKGA